MRQRKVELKGIPLSPGFPHAIVAMECIRQIDGTVNGAGAFKLTWRPFQTPVYPPPTFPPNLQKVFLDIIAPLGKEGEATVLEINRDPIPAMHEIVGHYPDEVVLAKLIVATVEQMDLDLNGLLTASNSACDYWDVNYGFDQLLRMAIFLSGSAKIFEQRPLGQVGSEEAWSSILKVCSRIASVSASFALQRYGMCVLVKAARLRFQSEADQTLMLMWQSVNRAGSVLLRRAEYWVYACSGTVSRSKSHPEATF